MCVSWTRSTNVLVERDWKTHAYAARRIHGKIGQHCAPHLAVWDEYLNIVVAGQLGHEHIARNLNAISEPQWPKGEQHDSCSHVREYALQRQPNRQRGDTEYSNDAGRLDFDNLKDDTKGHDEDGVVGQAGQECPNRRVHIRGRH